MFDIGNIKDLPTRDRLVLTACGLILRQSFASVSVDDICRAADIKKGTFYHHFPSKLELAFATYEFMWTEARKKLDACFSPTLQPLERLQRYAEGAYNCHKQVFDLEGKIYGCPIASAGHELAAQDDRIRLRLKDIFDGHCMYLASVVRDLPRFSDVSPEGRDQIARELFSYVSGVLYQAKVENDPEVIKRDLLSGLMRLIGEEKQTEPADQSVGISRSVA